MAIVFQSTLFDSAREAHLSCAAEWLCANGLNGKEIVLEILSEASDKELAKECNESWGMDALYEEEDPYYRENWFDIEELEQAFFNIREDLEYYFDWKD